MTIIRFNPIAPASQAAGRAQPPEPAPAARTPEARRTIAQRNRVRRERKGPTPRKPKALVSVAEALERAQRGQSLANYPSIISGFVAKGIPAADIKPRENVFTYDAWVALGRRVRKGEHGVKVVTMFTSSREVTDPETGEVQVKFHRRPWSTTVFHITQTEPAQKQGEAQPSEPLAPKPSAELVVEPRPVSPTPRVVPPAPPIQPAWVRRVRELARQGSVAA